MKFSLLLFLNAIYCIVWANICTYTMKRSSMDITYSSLLLCSSWAGSSNLLDMEFMNVTFIIFQIQNPNIIIYRKSTSPLNKRIPYACSSFLYSLRSKIYKKYYLYKFISNRYWIWLLAIEKLMLKSATTSSKLTLPSIKSQEKLSNNEICFLGKTLSFLL